MTRLASPIEKLESHYDVVVIGSGYGGAITASRLARAGRRVCVLERGRERQPGEFPSNALEAAPELQLDLPGAHVGPATGLYRLYLSGDINVLVACGLGGTSLINANVCLRPDPEVFADARWPREVAGDKLQKGFALAEHMLGATPYPEVDPVPLKLAALQRIADRLGKTMIRPPLGVTFADTVNPAGVAQKACKSCGDCAGGCNHGSKNTTLMNYLPDAHYHGAVIFTEIGVRSIERGDGGRGWRVRYDLLGVGRERFDAPDDFVTADIVILAAGTLGSTEILLRSKARGLACSDFIGRHFSGNGDAAGFCYNGPDPMESIGRDPSNLDPTDRVGPCITGSIEFREADRTKSFVIQEASLPSTLGPAIAPTLEAALLDFCKNPSPHESAAQHARAIESLLLGPYRGAVRNTLFLMGTGNDGGEGEIKLENDKPALSWENADSLPDYECVEHIMQDAAAALGGIYTREPLWNKYFGKKLTTAHPLGGCVMGNSAENAVVNHKGQVFSSNAGNDAHDGLYVCDGAVVPSSLGVNPLLTISALAERCAMIICEERGWTIDYAPNPPLVPDSAGATPTGLRFSERMSGWFQPGEDDYQKGADEGREAGSSCEFVVTVVSHDLSILLDGEAHQAQIVGTVRAPRLSPNPLLIQKGIFNLFTRDPSVPDGRLMRYRMQIVSEEGRTFYFSGFKSIRDESIFHAWHDCTTLYTTIYDGPDESAPIMGRGILNIGAGDFLKQLTTTEVTDAPSVAARLEALARFGRYFCGVLFDHYGHLFARASALHPNAPLRVQRPLRAPAPSLVPFSASDGKPLLLTRYFGGNKGPVILLHGLGASSAVFKADTIDVNLVEYLTAHQYDVWLLDSRASASLPPIGDYDLETVAKEDYPAALARVLGESGAASAQVVAHGWGAIGIARALLDGLSGVRGAVFLSGAPVVAGSPDASMGARLPHVLLHLVGLDKLDGDQDPGWFARRIDAALRAKAPPGEQCDNPVCWRLRFLYSLLYDHKHLNQATHGALHEWFGVAPRAALEGLGKLEKAGRLDGDFAKLALPIRFIHGADGQWLLPGGTEKAAAELSEKNGANYYSCKLIPGYGDIDLLIGRRAVDDIYPLILESLNDAPGK